MVEKGYRPDIDGLRAVAVLCVVFYHAGYGAFSGGYVGVDVFFVISGFLITRLIGDEIRAGRFRFSTFYLRRARRLFPAMFVTLVLTFLAGVLLFGPDELEKLSESVVYTVLSVSNFLFWLQSGYFDAAAETKPLLHTWSLCVEEQLCVVWPITLVGLSWWSRRLAARNPRHAGWIVPGFLVVAGVLSLVATEYVLRIDAAAAFFLPMFRITEFAIGALMVWVVAHRPSNSLLLEPLVPIGLVLIAWPVAFYSQETVFPGLAALPPCIGTALLIYSGVGTKAARLLNNRLAVGIGLISYSLYLVHWPIIVFYRHWVLRPLEPVEQAAIVAVSIILAVAMYWGVEQPFRRASKRPDAWSPRVFGLACVVFAALLVAPAASAWQSGGWQSRLPTELRDAVSKLGEKRKASWGPVRKLAARKAFEGTGRKVLVVGDSNAKDFANSLLGAEKESGVDLDVILRQVSYYCQPFLGERKPSNQLNPALIKKCNNTMEKLVTGDLVDEADVIVFSPRWTEKGVDHIEDTIRRIRIRTDTPIVLLGRTAEFTSVPQLLLQYGRFDGFDKYAARNRVDLTAINNRLDRIATETGVRYLPKDPLVCPDEARCDVLDDRDRLLIYDHGHWTLEGAAYYGKRMADSGFLDAILK